MDAILKNTEFADIYVEQGETPAFCYRSGCTVYEEVFCGKRLRAAGWNAAGYTLNVLEAMPTRLTYRELRPADAFRLEVDGASMEYDWRFAGFEKTTEKRGDAEILHGTVTLTSAVLPFTVKVHTWLDGTAMLTRALELVNEDTVPHAVSALSVLSGGVEESTDKWNTYFDAHDAKELYSLGTMQSSFWGCEGLFAWQPLPDARFCVDGGFNRREHRHPAFFLKNNRTGMLWFGQLAYSGGYSFTFDKAAEPCRTGADANLAWDFALTGPKPLLVLGAGERYVTPAMHIGAVMGDLDDAVNETHRHLRRSVFILPDARGKKCWVEAGIGCERTMDMTAIRHFADTAAAVGAEVFLVDAGWYCPPHTATAEWGKRAGDWYPDPERFPNGIGEARDYVHAKGMLFGLWMEAERIGQLSRVWQERPELRSHPYASDEESILVDMSCKETAAWVESEIVRVIETYRPDVFRLDHNTRGDRWFTRTEQHGRPACGILRHYDAVYDLYARLRRRFPDVIFENCAAGGARTDIGMVQNFTHTWVSDWNVAPRSVAITNGMTMVLPPERVDRLVSGMFCHTRGSLDLQVRHTLFARPTTNSYNCIGSEMNPAQIAFVRHSFDLYKNFIRPFAGTDRVYHHTPEINGAEPTGVCVLERAAEDRSRAVIGVFYLSRAGEGETTVFPRGIDGGARYRVTFDNSGEIAETDGFALTQQGLRVRVGGSLQSELVLLEKIGAARK